MSISRLHVEGFKALHDLSLQLAPGLVVLFGPNEAGKSTLTGFLRYVWFGVERGKPVDPLAGGRLGGRLWLDLPAGEAVLERSGKEDAELMLPDGRRLRGPDAPGMALGRVDRAMYDAVWSFSLDELRDLDGLGDDDLRERLFSGALAGDGQRVTQATKRLQERIDALWRPRARARLQEEEARRALVVQALDRARDEARGAEGLRRRIESVQAEIAALAPRLSPGRSQAERLKAQLAALPHQVELVAAGHALAAAPDPGPVPEAEQARIERLHHELPELESALRALAGRRATLADELRPDPGLLRWLQEAPAIAALRERAGVLERRESQAAQVAEAGRRLRVALSEAGLAGADELAALRLDPLRVGRVREAAVGAREALEVLARREEQERSLEALQADLGEAEARSLAAPRDPAALEAADEVRALRAEESAIAEAERDLRGQYEQVARTERELADLDAARGPGLAAARVDRAAQVSLGERLAEWTRKHHRLVGEQQAAQEAVRRAEAEQVVVVRPADPAPVAAELGRPWDVAAVAAARLDRASLDALRLAAREAGEAAREERRLQEGARLAQEAVGRSRAAGGLSREALNQRLAALFAADAALRRLDEARGHGAPAWGQAAAIVVGLLTALLGVVVLVGGAWAGAALVVLGLCVVVAAWLWLAPAAGIDPGVVQAEAAEKLRQAGLPAGAGAAAIAEARATAHQGMVELGAAEGQAARVAEHERAVERARRAAHGLQEALRRASWPAGLGADAVESALLVMAAWATELRRVEEAREEARAQQERRAAAVERTKQALQAAERAMQAHEAAGAALREQAGRLGVPAEVGIEALDAWLADAVRRRELALARDQASEAHQRAVRRVTGWRSRLDALAATLGAPADLAAWVKRCEQAARAEEAWRALDGRVQVSRQEVDRAALVLRSLQARAVEPALQAWREALVEVGLPVDRSPTEHRLDPLLAAAQRRLELEQAEVALADTDAQIARLQADAEALAQRLDPQGAGDAGGPRPEQLATWLRQQEEVVGRAREAEAESKRQADVLAGLDRELQQQTADRDARREELAARLRALGCEDVEAMRARIVAHGAHLQARQRRETAERLRDEALGVHRGDPELLRALQEPDEVAWREQVEASDGERERLERRRDALWQDQGHKEAELHRLEQAHDVARLSLELQEIEASVEQSRRELARLHLAKSLLEHTLGRFREAHQPTILREASRLLSVATAGVYVRVEADDEGRDLWLIDRNGGRRSTKQLSRGTAELLYLVLRLGLLRDQVGRDHGAALPVVMDDVLVNLDPERATEVARLIADVARQQQVILLTCRPDTQQVLLEACPTAQVHQLARYGGRAGPPTAVTSRRAARAVEAAGPAPTRGADVSEASAALLAAIEQHPEGLGKAALLRAAGVAEADWDRAIGALLEAGSVVGRGEKRGRVYLAQGEAGDTTGEPPA